MTRPEWINYARQLGVDSPERFRTRASVRDSVISHLVNEKYTRFVGDTFTKRKNVISGPIPNIPQVAVSTGSSLVVDLPIKIPSSPKYTLKPNQLVVGGSSIKGYKVYDADNLNPSAFNLFEYVGKHDIDPLYTYSKRITTPNGVYLTKRIDSLEDYMFGGVSNEYDRAPPPYDKWLLIHIYWKLMDTNETVNDIREELIHGDKVQIVSKALPTRVDDIVEYLDDPNTQYNNALALGLLLSTPFSVVVDHLEQLQKEIALR